jgi:DNA-binding transcriptional MerR regulator
MTIMTIGEFAERTRLSPKALRLYDQLGLVVPVEVDADSGYRYYAEDQIDGARLVGLLRRLDMSLVEIASVLAMDADDAAAAVAAYWTRVEADVAGRRMLAAYLQTTLKGEHFNMYNVEIRPMPERKIVSITRHVDEDKLHEVFFASLSRLKEAGSGIDGIEGALFQIFYGEVSGDSDGPWELCRPVALDTDEEAVKGMDDVLLRTEPAHEEAFIRLTLEESALPGMLSAIDHLIRWAGEHQRQPAGPIRLVFVAFGTQPGPGDPFYDVSVPLVSPEP